MSVFPEGAGNDLGHQGRGIHELRVEPDQRPSIILSFTSTMKMDMLPSSARDIDRCGSAVGTLRT